MEESSNRYYNIHEEVSPVLRLNRWAGLIPISKPKMIHKAILYTFLLCLVAVPIVSYTWNTGCHLSKNHKGYVTMTHCVACSWMCVFTAYALRRKHGQAIERACSIIRKVDVYLEDSGIPKFQNNRNCLAMIIKYMFFVLHLFPVYYVVQNDFHDQSECEHMVMFISFVCNVTMIQVILDLLTRQFTIIVHGISKRYALLKAHLSTTSTDEGNEKLVVTTIDSADALLEAAKNMNDGYSPILLIVVCNVFLGVLTATTTISARLHESTSPQKGPEDILRPSILLTLWVWLLIDLTRCAQQCERHVSKLLETEWYTLTMVQEAMELREAVYTEVLTASPAITSNVQICAYLGRKDELRFEVYGMFRIDNTLIYSIISLTCAYCIVLLQTSSVFNKKYGQKDDHKEQVHMHEISFGPDEDINEDPDEDPDED